MENIDNSWFIYGVEWEDNECIRTVDEAVDYINDIGFLPLFRNEIPGFSLEERTYAPHWWCDNPDKDPWMWRAIIARAGNIAYGKFFDKKAGFISRKWLPHFVNYRRDGYDFDALYDDGKASRRQKLVMNQFPEGREDSEIFSNDLKKIAGFGKDGEKGFDGTITSLMMQMYLCNYDFRKRKNKKGLEYGWDVSVYSTLEHIFGYDYVTSAYKEEPKESLNKIVNYLHEIYPVANKKSIYKLLK